MEKSARNETKKKRGLESGDRVDQDLERRSISITIIAVAEIRSTRKGAILVNVAMIAKTLSKKRRSKMKSKKLKLIQSKNKKKLFSSKLKRLVRLAMIIL